MRNKELQKAPKNHSGIAAQTPNIFGVGNWNFWRIGVRKFTLA